MAKKTIKRIQCGGKLSTPEAAGDREIRGKIMEEFPPLEAKPDSPVLSNPLREAIGRSGKSVHRVAKKAKVSEIVLQQFLDGQRDLHLATAERLAQILGLRLVAN